MANPVNDFTIEFEPSPAVKRRWLAVRQERLALSSNASKSFLGMHHTSDGKGETFALAVALLAEVWVAWNTYLATDYPWWVCFFLPAAISIGLALVGHVRVSDEHAETVELEVTDDGNRRGRLAQAIARKRLWRFAFAFLVVLVAGANGFLFFLARQRLDGTAFSVLFALVVATAVHTTITGYFAARLWWRLALWFEHRDYNADAEKAPTRFWSGYRAAHNAPELSNLSPFIVQQGRHWFTNTDVATHGMLTDEEAVAIAAGIRLESEQAAREPIAREIALRELRRHQLRLLSNAPIARKQGQTAVAYLAAPTPEQVQAHLTAQTPNPAAAEMNP